MTTEKMAPIAVSERIDVIDVLRGLALFGIIAANMRGFAAPAQAYFNPKIMWAGGVDRFVQAVIDTLIQGKFITLFAFLFGLGFAVQMERAAARGAGFKGFYVRRKITPDASRIVAEVIENKLNSVRTTRVSGGGWEKLCDDCSLLDLSSDGKKALFYFGQPIRFAEIDLATRNRADVLSHPTYSLHRGQYSPHGRWIAFHIPANAEGRSVVFVTELRQGRGSSEEKDWIVVGDSGGDTHPWWSPDGNLLYFFSERDGFRCIFARRLYPATHRPKGEAFDVYHFHSAQRALPPAPGIIGPSLIKDRLVFTLRETRSNVWLADLNLR